MANCAREIILVISKEQGAHMQNICYVSIGEQEKITVAFTEDMRLWQLARNNGFDDTVCAMMNGRIVSLTDVPEPESVVQFLSPYENEQASRVFLRGATFMLYRAAHELYPERRFVVEYMLCGGIYCEMEPFEKADIEALQQRMEELVLADDDFVLHLMRVDEAKRIMLDEGLKAKAELLSYRPFDYYRLYEYGGLHNYFHGIMPKSAGYLKDARLYAYGEGMILKIPTPYHEASVSIIDQPKYADVFEEAERWGRELSVSCVADINNIFREGGMADFIRVNEAMHERTIADIARMIAQKDHVRVVLVAGPSSSGKTTFATRLSVHLKALGRRCRPISVDDYYKNREDIPFDEQGKLDFECIEALDTQKLGEDLQLLLSGEEAQMPRFDFLTGKRFCETVPMKIDDDILIIEGIHGLNNALTFTVPADKKFKIFISPLTTLNIDGHSVVMPEDLRLLRRLVRDKRTRGYSFSQTFAIWDSVRRGEFKFILPYQHTADVMFNSTLLYEPLLLKKHAYSDLRRFTPDMPHYPEALDLLKFLNYFLSFSDEGIVPHASILREFIG